MIPKIIHYCQYGIPKSPLVESCIASWRKYLPDYEIKEWNERTFPVDQYPFTKRMYAEKKFAFVADYARLIVLEREGGIYLDTDMEIVASLNPLLDTELLLGEEEPGIVSAGMVAGVAHHPFFKACIEYYDTRVKELVTIPRVLTTVFEDFKNAPGLKVLPPIAFYPYSAETISKYKKEDLTHHTYGVHLWNYSWGHPLNRFFKRVGVHRIGTKVAEKLGVKKILKKVFGFI